MMPAAIESTPNERTPNDHWGMMCTNPVHAHEYRKTQGCFEYSSFEYKYKYEYLPYEYEYLSYEYEYEYNTHN